MKTRAGHPSNLSGPLDGFFHCLLKKVLLPSLAVQGPDKASPRRPAVASILMGIVVVFSAIQFTPNSLRAMPGGLETAFNGMLAAEQGNNTVVLSPVRTDIDGFVKEDVMLVRAHHTFRVRAGAKALKYILPVGKGQVVYALTLTVKDKDGKNKEGKNKDKAVYTFRRSAEEVRKIWARDADASARTFARALPVVKSAQDITLSVEYIETLGPGSVRRNTLNPDVLSTLMLALPSPPGGI